MLRFQNYDKPATEGMIAQINDSRHTWGSSQLGSPNYDKVMTNEMIAQLTDSCVVDLSQP